MSSVSSDMSPDSPSGQNWDAGSPEGKGSYVNPEKAPLYPVLEGIREGFLEKETSAPRPKERIGISQEKWLRKGLIVFQI